MDVVLNYECLLRIESRKFKSQGIEARVEFKSSEGESCKRWMGSDRNVVGSWSGDGRGLEVDKRTGIERSLMDGRETVSKECGGVERVGRDV